MNTVSIEAIQERLKQLPPDKLEVVYDFVSYMADRHPGTALETIFVQKTPSNCQNRQLASEYNAYFFFNLPLLKKTFLRIRRTLTFVHFLFHPLQSLFCNLDCFYKVLFLHRFIVPRITGLNGITC
jgi:hypothetical protein